MKKKTGFKYVVEGFKDMEKFAKGILAITNLKSSRENTIINIKTYEGTWKVSIISIEEIDDFLKLHFEKIILRELIECIVAEYEDLSNKIQRIVSEKEDESEEFYITIFNG